MYFYAKKFPLSGCNYDKLTKNNDNLIMKRCRNSMETWTTQAGKNFHSCKTVGWNYQFKEYNAMHSGPFQTLNKFSYVEISIRIQTESTVWFLTEMARRYRKRHGKVLR